MCSCYFVQPLCAFREEADANANANSHYQFKQQQNACSPPPLTHTHTIICMLACELTVTQLIIFVFEVTEQTCFYFELVTTSESRPGSVRLQLHGEVTVNC